MCYPFCDLTTGPVWILAFSQLKGRQLENGLSVTGVCLGQELSLAASPVDWCSGSLDLNLPSSSTLEQLEGEGHTQPPDEPPCLISSRALLGGTWTGLFIQCSFPLLLATSLDTGIWNFPAAPSDPFSGPCLIPHHLRWSFCFHPGTCLSPLALPGPPPWEYPSFLLFFPPPGTLCLYSLATCSPEEE